MKVLTGRIRSWLHWGPKCSPETQQSQGDEVSSRRPSMVRILRVAATAAADSRFPGIQLWELSGLFGVYNPNVLPSLLPPLPASGSTSFPINAQLTEEKTRGGEGLNRTGWGRGRGERDGGGRAGWGAGSVGEPFWVLVSDQDTTPSPRPTALPALSSEEASAEASVIL